MYINTRISTQSLKKMTKEEEKKWEKQRFKLKFEKRIGEKNSEEMKKVRNALLHAIEQDAKNIDECIRMFEEVKEKEFIKTHGMTSAEYKEKLEKEQYEKETVAVRECLCNNCSTIFKSERLYPTCQTCGYERMEALEKEESSDLEGKTIKEVYKGYYETILIFSDGTRQVFADYSQDE